MRRVTLKKKGDCAKAMLDGVPNLQVKEAATITKTHAHTPLNKTHALYSIISQGLQSSVSFPVKRMFRLVPRTTLDGSCSWLCQHSFQNRPFSSAGILHFSSVREMQSIENQKKLTKRTEKYANVL